MAKAEGISFSDFRRPIRPTLTGIAVHVDAMIRAFTSAMRSSVTRQPFGSRLGRTSLPPFAPPTALQTLFQRVIAGTSLEGQFMRCRLLTQRAENRRPCLPPASTPLLVRISEAP